VKLQCYVFAARVSKGRHFEASLILQAVSWYLRYPLSYRDIEERCFGSAVWRWTIAP